MKVSQFYVIFSVQLLTTVATRGEIFSLKFTKYRLATMLCPDKLGDLKSSQDSLATIRGLTSKGRGAEKKIYMGGKGQGRRNRKRKGREGEGRRKGGKGKDEGLVPSPT